MDVSIKYIPAKIGQMSNKPKPEDFSMIATDFYHRLYNRSFHLVGSGHGSKSHVMALVQALNKTPLKFTYSFLGMKDWFGEGGYREISDPTEISEIPKYVEVIGLWDDFAMTGVSTASDEINVLYLKDKIGFKELILGITADMVGLGNIALVSGYSKYYGPRKFLEKRFPKISDPTIERRIKQKQLMEARKRTVNDLKSRGLLKAISSYRYKESIKIEPVTVEQLVQEYNKRKQGKEHRWGIFRKRMSSHQLLEKVLNVKNDK